MRVAQVSTYVDPLRRTPADLLQTWPSLAGVAQATAEAGHEITVLQGSVVDETIQQDGVTFEFVRSPTVSRWRRRLGYWVPQPRRLLSRLMALDPDVVHIHGLSLPAHIRSLTAALPRRHFLVQDHADRPPHLWERPRFRAGLQRVAGVAFTARELAEPFRAVLPSGARVFEVLESSTRFTPGDQRVARERTGLHGEPCLLWLGRLDANKDPLTVLEGLSRAAPALPDMHLWCFYQEAPLREAVERRIRQDGRLEGRVHLMGARPHAEVEHLLRAADFLVQGSHHESCGFAVVEALACGTVPIVTNIPSLRRITANGTVGGMFPPGDSAEMTRVLCEWARRDRTAIRRAAQEHFATSLSFRALANDLSQAYHVLCGR